MIFALVVLLIDHGAVAVAVTVVVASFLVAVNVAAVTVDVAATVDAVVGDVSVLCRSCDLSCYEIVAARVAVVIDFVVVGDSVSGGDARQKQTTTHEHQMELKQPSYATRAGFQPEQNLQKGQPTTRKHKTHTHTHKIRTKPIPRAQPRTIICHHQQDC